MGLPLSVKQLLLHVNVATSGVPFLGAFDRWTKRGWRSITWQVSGIAGPRHPGSLSTSLVTSIVS